MQTCIWRSKQKKSRGNCARNIAQKKSDMEQRNYMYGHAINEPPLERKLHFVQSGKRRLNII